MTDTRKEPTPTCRNEMCPEWDASSPSRCSLGTCGNVPYAEVCRHRSAKRARKCKERNRAR